MAFATFLFARDLHPPASGSSPKERRNAANGPDDTVPANDIDAVWSIDRLLWACPLPDNFGAENSSESSQLGFMCAQERIRE
mmetsp:Transcript_21476/g.43746  ORF Transcript_21476/g.43746 Transcript_21476/m.43746 type:complete len:82 (+) Transcript_21476:411-656(+)